LYSAQITRANPTLIILLIDQSGSMVDTFGGGRAGRKADFVSDVVNNTLHDLVIRCTKTEEIRNYYYVSVIGYGRHVGSAFGGSLLDRGVVPVSDLADYPLKVETRMKRVSDGYGGTIEVPYRFPIWTHPLADGGTPMCEAFRRAKAVLQTWLREHPTGFPPTILHLTDGESGDGDPTQIGQEIMSQGTDDGNALIFNCHLSSSSAQKIEYPASAYGLNDKFAQTLFGISSVLPAGFVAAAQQLGVSVADGSRGFVFNADPSSVVQFYEIGTSLTGMVVTPHRWMDPDV